MIRTSKFLSEDVTVLMNRFYLAYFCTVSCIPGVVDSRDVKHTRGRSGVHAFLSQLLPFLHLSSSSHSPSSTKALRRTLLFSGFTPFRGIVCAGSRNRSGSGGGWETRAMVGKERALKRAALLKKEKKKKKLRWLRGVLKSCDNRLGRPR